MNKLIAFLIFMLPGLALAQYPNPTYNSVQVINGATVGTVLTVGGSNVVTGPGSSTTNDCAAFADTTGHVIKDVSCGGGAPSGAAGGDLGGTYPNPTVISVADITTGTLGVANGGSGHTTGQWDLGSSILTQLEPNAGTTGTTLNKLAKYNASGQAVVLGTTDTQVVLLGICSAGCGTSGSATMAISGTVNCVFDGTVTAGHYVVASTTTGGDCHDGGATLPTAVNVVGVVPTSHTGAGTYSVDINPVGVTAASTQTSYSAGAGLTLTGSAFSLALGHANVWTAQQSNSPVALTIATSTFTPTGAGNNYSITLVHASCPCTIANPSATPVAGTAGQIVIVQSSTGSDTIGTWGSQYKFAGGTAPTLSTAANAVDILSYYVTDSTHINVAVGGLAFQ